MRAAAAVAVLVVAGLGCSTDEPPPQLLRIDGPAEVDQERLGGEPGAVNDGGQGG